jgi:hypothetical protein
MKKYKINDEQVAKHWLTWAKYMTFKYHSRTNEIIIRVKPI